ncbi:hypothetical protein EIP86_004533 [Pleurotus ostreatoroseus]|nr:hypothetical protein EIP86_004533 [Pleurotus ostreatoroseus]
MVFAAALFCQLLIAASALAIPSSSDRLAARVARRAAGSHLSRPKIPVSSVSTLTSGGNVTHAETSENWSGAVLVASSGTFKSVTGTFTVPTPKSPSGSRGSSAASAWVGIDGDTCDTAILQTGVDFTVDGSEVSFDAWYEYYPDFATDFSGITVHAGDEIKLTVTASSTTSGTAVIENVTRGQTVSKSLSSSAKLCQENAEWIVEDFEEGDSLVPFANFGTVEFTGASATTSSGTVTPAGATLIDIEQNGQVLTSASTSGSSVTVSYV